MNSLQCLATARRRGELVRGIRLALEGEIFAGSDAETLNLLSRKSRSFNPAARFSWDLPDHSAAESAVGIMLTGGLSGEQQVVVEDTLSGETRSFSNPGVGMVELDTAAFPTCP